jgi:hypothetical protein
MNKPIKSPQAFLRSDSGNILSIAEVARILGCSKAHVCNAINGRVKGVTRLPAISMGRRKLVRQQSLESWLAHNDSSSTHAIMQPSHSDDAVDA